MTKEAFAQVFTGHARALAQDVIKALRKREEERELTALAAEIKGLARDLRGLTRAA